MTRLPIGERRTHLVRAAVEVAARDGLEHTTVRAIALEAGVSLGVVHYCFRDKAAILRAVARELTVGSLNDAFIGQEVSPDNWAQVLADSYTQMVVSDPNRQLLALEIMLESLRDPDLAGVATEHLQLRLQNMEKHLLRAGEALGLMWDSPRELARYVLRQVDGTVLIWTVDRDVDALRLAMGEICHQVELRSYPDPNRPRTAAQVP